MFHTHPYLTLALWSLVIGVVTEVMIMRIAQVLRSRAARRRSEREWVRFRDRATPPPAEPLVRVRGSRNVFQRGDETVYISDLTSDDET